MSFINNLPESLSLSRRGREAEMLEILAGLESVLAPLYRTLKILNVGTLAERPTADGKPKLYFATDEEVLYYDSGSWVDVLGLLDVHEHVAVIDGNPHGTNHSQLDDVIQSDETESDTDLGKHVTNLQVKYYKDSSDAAISHIEASSDVHSIGELSAVVGTHTDQYLTNKKLGIDTDYTEFESDGSMEMHGAATVYEDLIGSALQLKVSGSGLSINASENLLEFTTAANLLDYGYDNYQIRHAWEIGTSIYPHIHWEQSQSNTPNWLLQYRWQMNGEAKTTAWTNYPLTTNAFTYVSGTLNQISAGAGLTPPVAAGLSDVLELRIIRDNANTSTVFAGPDPYTTTVGLTSVDIHIRENTLGSRQEFVK